MKRNAFPSQVCILSDSLTGVSALQHAAAMIPGMFCIDEVPNISVPPA